MKSQVHLHGWGLWKYICGPESMLPIIPPLHEETRHKGCLDDGTVKTFCITGNAVEHDKIIVTAEPWMAQNNLMLFSIYMGLSSCPLHRV